jgi:hypothetical protein
VDNLPGSPSDFLAGLIGFKMITEPFQGVEACRAFANLSVDETPDCFALCEPALSLQFRPEVIDSDSLLFDFAGVERFPVEFWALRKEPILAMPSGGRAFEAVIILAAGEDDPVVFGVLGGGFEGKDATGTGSDLVGSGQFVEEIPTGLSLVFR